MARLEGGQIGHGKPIILAMPAPLDPRVRDCLENAMLLLGEPAIGRWLERFQGLYQALDESARLALFDHLAIGMEIDEAAMPGAASADAVEAPGDAGKGMAAMAQQAAILNRPLDLDGPGAGETVDRLLRLREGLEAPRLHFFRQFVNVRGGIKFLVDMRADLLAAMRHHRDRPAWRLVDADLLHLFRTWFNHGFLRLVPINWHRTPAAQLEKLMAFDVVHPMSDWADLRRRLDRDRLCFGFYHPNLPEEPLIFVEVALTRTIATSIDMLFDPLKMLDRIEDATTAIFYSINATQPGLAGVSLGNSLIKMVVEQLGRDYPHIHRFSTLSPMPGFRDRYLLPILADDAAAARFALTAGKLEAMFDADDAAAVMQLTGAPTLLAALRRVLNKDSWAGDRTLRAALKPGLLRAAHFYLTREKRGRDPLNPVAAFHLRNGAVIYNINFLSNTGAKGMAESFGMTVNYHYAPDHIQANQRRAREGEAAISPQLEKMLKLGVSA